VSGDSRSKDASGAETEGALTRCHWRHSACHARTAVLFQRGHGVRWRGTAFPGVRRRERRSHGNCCPPGRRRPIP